MLLVPYSMIQYVVNDEISCTIQTTYALIFSQESSVKLLGRESERLQIILLNLFSEKKKKKNKNNPEVVYLLEGGTPYLISIYLHSSCFVLRDITNGYQSIHYLYNSSLTQCSEKWKPLFSTGMQMVLALKRLCSVKTFWT